MEIFNKLSKDYDRCLLDSINNFSIEFLKNNLEATKSFCVSYPKFGYREKPETSFLFYGQAVNGGFSKFLVDKSVALNHDSALESSINDANYHHPDFNPQDSVNIRWSKGVFNKLPKEVKDYYDWKDVDYFCYRSFFNNVIYKTICDYCNFVGGRNSWEWSIQNSTRGDW